MSFKKSFLKLSELGTSRMWVGSAFHADGPSCENARSPNLVLIEPVTWGRRVQVGCINFAIFGYVRETIEKP